MFVKIQDKFYWMIHEMNQFLEDEDGYGIIDRILDWIFINVIGENTENNAENDDENDVANNTSINSDKDELEDELEVVTDGARTNSEDDECCLEFDEEE